MSHKLDAMLRGAASVQLIRRFQLPRFTKTELQRYAESEGLDADTVASGEGRWRLAGMLTYTISYLLLLALVVVMALAEVSLTYTLPVAVSPLLLTLFVRYYALRTFG